MNGSVPQSLLLVLLALAAFAAQPEVAQPLPAQSLPAQSIVSIPAQQCIWRAGDNPAWAAPNLDESGWQPYAAWKPDPGQLQIWIRCRANVSESPGGNPPQIQVGLYASYQLYLEGNLLGGSGNLGSGNFSLHATRSFPVPARLFEPGHISLALRVTRHRALAIGGPIPSLVTQPLELRFGNADLLDALRARAILQRTSSYADTAACYGVIGVVALMLLGLFLYDPSRRELLLLCIACLSLAILRLNEFCTISQLNYSLDACTVMVSIANLAFTATQVPFFFALARRRIPFLIWIAFAVALLAHAFAGIDALLGLHGPFWLKEHSVPLVLVVALPSHIVLTLAPYIAFWPYSRIAPRMRPVAALCLLWGTADLAWFIVQGTQLIPLPDMQSLFAHWQLSLLETRAFTTAGVLAALLALLFRDQRQVTQDRAMLAGEMRAARAVQQVIIPEAIPKVPGFAIENVYKPAGEVGGDFFQILPTPAGGVLIAIGDVSGKGMPAALTVSLLVGTIRTLAHYTHNPGEILATMNTRMLGRSQGGFTTCLVLQAGADGKLTVANAGHLAPYLNGTELALANGLPLGLDAHSTYPESEFQLPPGAKLTVLSDGVVEARNASGELFGFERTAAISTQSAESIAHAAQAFGQEDDITVLTLTLAPAPAPAPIGAFHG
jgi:Stage II sporulation protein E (SpoIIE)